MDPRVYSFNKDIAYRTGAVYAAGTPTKLALAGALEIVVNANSAFTASAFTARVPSFLDKYKLPLVSSDHVVDLWNSQPMGFWQNQINFAVWCASTGCGVSVEHMSSPGLLGTLFRFHVYYTARRLQSELRIALPQDPSWNAFENTYDRRAYERLCRDFGVDPDRMSDTVWRRGGLPNSSLGRAYANGHPIGDGQYYPKFTWGWRGSGTNVTHDPSAPSGWLKESMSEPGSEKIIHVDYIAQDDSGADTAWTTFIMDKSEGFTQAGVERLNDSIRTYVWAILGAQGQTRTSIIGTGTAFDAQRQFLANLEDAITRPVDLPEAIRRYQDTLQYASSKVDYVFGVGLYMAPSDMQLRIGQIQGYNNEIQVATAGMKIGPNVDVNGAPVPPAAPPSRDPLPAHHEVSEAPSPMPVATTSASEVAVANQHLDEKTALIVGLVAASLFFLWWR